MLDDCYMPSVGVLADLLRAHESWEAAATPGRRTAVFRKLGDALPDYEWRGERIGGGMSFRYLPPLQRARALVEHRVLESRIGRAAAARLRRR